MEKNVYIKGLFEKGCIYEDENTYDLFDLDGISNNECEWITCVSGIFLFSGTDVDVLNIYMDNKIVWKQLERICKTKKWKLKKHYIKNVRNINIMRDVKVNYIKIKREENPARKIIEESLNDKSESKNTTE